MTLRPNLTMEVLDAYLHNLYVQPDFVYSVTRDFVSSCGTPIRPPAPGCSGRARQ
jgi:hypothetical protein